MQQLQNERITLMLPPESKNGAAFSAQIPMDISGAGEAKIELLVGAADTTIGSSGAANAIQLEECDTVDGTYTDIAGAALSGAIAATDDGKVFAIQVPLRPMRKKYVRVKAPTAGSGSTGAHLAIRGVVTKMDIGPMTAAERGYAAHIIP